MHPKARFGGRALVAVLTLALLAGCAQGPGGDEKVKKGLTDEFDEQVELPAERSLRDLNKILSDD